MGMNRTAFRFALAAGLALGGSAAHADWLIRGATVIDGSGGAPVVADVALRQGRIDAIGKLEARPGDTVVEAKGLVLAPGFIDAHSHHDRLLDSIPAATAVVSQGVTTIVAGVDGQSKLPLSDAFGASARVPVAINVASFSGHGTIRRAVMGEDYRRVARADEVARMVELMKADMQSGSLGLSSGLEYDPGIYSETAEIIALARVAAASGGIYTSHVRSEDVNLDTAFAEVAEIARSAKIPADISHIKISLLDRWGDAPNILKRFDAWRAEGLDITGDVYPYTYWHSTLTSIFPKRNFDSLEDARHVLKHVAPADGIIFARYLPEPRFRGMTVAEIAAERKEAPEVTLLWLIKRAYPDGKIYSEFTPDAVMGVSMSEQDVETFINWPHTVICSDGALESGHPRGAGAFTRYLRHYVLDKDPALLPAAIRRMTSATAERMHIPDRGLVAVGKVADIVLFDPATVRDNASIKEPGALSSGVRSVWVNGEQVWDGSKSTPARPGKMLKRA